MTPNRWTLALDDGAIAMPDGACLVIGARGDADFAGLGDVTCVQGFAPDHQRLVARGLNVVVAADGMFATALVQIVKARAATLSMIATAFAHLKPGGLLLVDGPKDEGIEAILKQLRQMFGVDGVISKSHGKLIWLTRPDTLPDAARAWVAVPAKGPDGYVTVPGGFSADGPDRGSELLAALVPPLKGRIADLGAGWGYIAAEVLAEQPAITQMHLIEADHAMLAAARANLDDPRAVFHWADATTFTPADRFDAILCNPPFHIGRKADPGLGRAFIAAAARLLKPQGQFYMVANRHLPYEAALKAAFATGAMLAELEGYKLYQAGKPRRG
jgi:16S rRNA (guanine1207-N2)-methyltransferase